LLSHAPLPIENRKHIAVNVIGKMGETKRFNIMKKLSWFNKAVFLLNFLFAIFTLIGYLLPFFPPTIFPVLSVLTLGLPFLLLINISFLIYWLLQIKIHLFLSALVLLVGFNFMSKWYRFSSKNYPKENTDFTIMSYNVRLFNKYKWLDNDSVLYDIKRFVDNDDPTILCVQEFSDLGENQFNIYPYKAVYHINKKRTYGNAIFSKYPIIHSDIIRFENSNNNVIFADIKKERDTIRVYSMHLQSVQITDNIVHIENELNQEKSEIIFEKLSNAFIKQQEQAIVLQNHTKQCDYPTIICGDLNNSAFSYVYRTVKGTLNDAFEQAGKGFGKSYMFRYYPIRIDYILYHKSLIIKDFVTFNDIELSDHYPIKARFSLHTNP